MNSEYKRYRVYKPNDITEGFLACDKCIHCGKCENSEDCDANCIFDNSIWHYVSCEHVANGFDDMFEEKEQFTKCDDILQEFLNVRVVGVEGGQPGDEEFIIHFENNKSLKFYHSQSCCEQVEIDDVNGDVNDLVGNLFFGCSVKTSHDNPKTKYDTSHTWTFYTFKYPSGYIDMKWYGCSNGYYSESVDYLILDSTTQKILDFGFGDWRTL